MNAIDKEKLRLFDAKYSNQRPVFKKEVMDKQYNNSNKTK